MSSLLILEAMNLFAGDHNPDNSKHLTLASVKLPTFEEMNVEHTPGGSLAGINLGMGTLNPLEMTFKLNGYDPGMMAMFGIGKKTREVYTGYGVIRDKRTSKAAELKAIIHARLNRIEPDEFTRGELAGNDHGLIEIMHYEEYYDGVEKKYFDFFNQIWRVDGVSQNADERRILRIPGAA